MANANDNDVDLFLAAVKGARPLTKPKRVRHAPLRPKPVPIKFISDEQESHLDSLSDHFIPAHELEIDAALRYLREGHSPDILRKLRRGHWRVQATIDLHGMMSDDARFYVSRFISDCKNHDIRCLRIVHGKGLGSRNNEPVLKHKLRGWLMQKDEVIAYVEAARQEGGSGAVTVLLKAS